MDLSQPNIDIPAALHDAFAAARRAYESSRMPSAAERRQSLTRLEQLLVNHREAIEAAISSDFGNRSRHETQLLEIFPALGTVRDARKHVARWMKPARAWASLWFLPARTE
ncbi:MAG: aldehyde dehydrogenase family protein, partial [Burkholderiales bacterium]|nr:aldehyde dehydrogenase family protein [Burkholderiales bacterium]